MDPTQNPFRDTASASGDNSPGTEGSSLARRWRTVAVIAGLGITVAVAVAAALNVTDPEANVTVYTQSELLEVSQFLAAGSRNGKGSGPIFIGTVNEGWNSASAKLREESAEAIGRKLQLSGVTSVMLFDTERRLQLQYKSGEIKHLSD